MTQESESGDSQEVKKQALLIVVKESSGLAEPEGRGELALNNVNELSRATKYRQNNKADTESDLPTCGWCNRAEDGRRENLEGRHKETALDVVTETVRARHATCIKGS